MDYSKVCRICLINEDGLHDVLDKSEASKVFVEMYNHISEVMIEGSNGLSSFLCSNCKEDLSRCYHFLQKCRKANKVLQEYKDMVTSSVKSRSLKKIILQQIIQESEIGNFGPKDMECEKVKQKGGCRLEKYPYDDVDEAIEAARSRYYNNTECPKCNFTASNLSALKAHISHTHRELKNKWCSYCNSIIESDLAPHLEQHEEENLKCRFCNKKYKEISPLVEHLKRHSEFVCPYCPHRFRSEHELHDHKSTHKTNINDSNQSESQKGEATINKSADTNKDSKAKPLCTFCGKQFKDMTKLREHTRKHTGETPYKCTHCEKSFASRNNLVCHERKHTGEKPYACPICGKRFPQHGARRTHMRLHTGRPEVCPVCSKRFCIPTQLRLHMRRHTGERPFVCETCGSTFAMRNHLNDHIRTHSEDRPFKCKECGKGFKHQTTLRGHMQTHDDTKPYMCTRCPYACKQKKNLKTHMKQHAEVDESVVDGCGVPVFTEVKIEPSNQA